MMHNEHTKDKVRGGDKLSLARLSITWAGFPFIISHTILGAVLVLKSSLITALSGIIIGNILLFFYVGWLGEIGWREGRSFAQIAEVFLGKHGYKIVSGMLSLLVLGWFAINTAMPCEILSTATHYPYWIVAVILGSLFVAITFFGIYGLNIISSISIPIYLGAIIYAFVLLSKHYVLGNVSGAIGNHQFTFAEVLTAEIASFADSGTMAADFNRWAKTRTESWLSVIPAFPIANGIAGIAGALFTYELWRRGLVFNKPFQISNPIGYLASIGGVGVLLAVFVSFVNQGSNAAHCLYNSAVGISKISGKSYHFITIIAGAVGIMITSSGIWSLLLSWLNIIGIMVPPIGGVILAVYLTRNIKFGLLKRLENANRVLAYGVDQRTIAWIGLICGWVSGFIISSTHLKQVVPISLGTFTVAIVATITMIYLYKLVGRSALPIRHPGEVE
ncbi:purine-cytosine permease family protein [Acidithiobacillus ferrianus]|uniref:purine-cytosine permease family protein n=1 Tax=Acidithiobacillus ferrianus TaxID=2678518 RepID=UPI0034E5D5BF